MPKCSRYNWRGKIATYCYTNKADVSMSLSAEQVLAPGYKGRARFKFFAERCPHHKNNFHDFEQQLSPILVGRSVGRLTIFSPRLLMCF